MLSPYSFPARPLAQTSLVSSRVLRDKDQTPEALFPSVRPWGAFVPYLRFLSQKLLVVQAICLCSLLKDFQRTKRKLGRFCGDLEEENIIGRLPIPDKLILSTLNTSFRPIRYSLIPADNMGVHTYRSRQARSKPPALKCII